MNIKEFEKVVLETIESIPEKFQKKLKNISVVIEETDGESFFEKEHGSTLLGLYQGLPLTMRAGKRNLIPDKITIYKGHLEKISINDTELKKNIRRVVLHEIGHFFGLDEDKLKDLGY